jgi:hypothetical protein
LFHAAGHIGRFFGRHAEQELSQAGEAFSNSITQPPVMAGEGGVSSTNAGA